jgi:hypothetical protein
MEVPLIDDARVKQLSVVHHALVRLLGDHPCRFAVFRVDVVVQVLYNLRERLFGFLVQVRDGNACGEDRIVGVLGRQVGGSLRGEVVKLDGSDTLVDSRDDLLRDPAVHDGWMSEGSHEGSRKRTQSGRRSRGPSHSRVSPHGL